MKYFDIIAANTIFVGFFVWFWIWNDYCF